jgi:2-hydroxychromene-2-carboxylate isomerase
MQIWHYFDYKSPYAYLAQEETLALADLSGVELIMRPYTLHIPSYLGSAEVDRDGKVLHAERNEHQWRRVRYSYMDCRREANRRGLTIRGPRKIMNSAYAHVGFLWALAHQESSEQTLQFHMTIYERFWRRELDIEDISALEGVLAAQGITTQGFADYCHGEGMRLHDENQADAEGRGIFGVPSYLVDGELFWGGERLERVQELAGAKGR